MNRDEFEQQVKNDAQYVKTHRWVWWTAAALAVFALGFCAASHL
jgi:hypothetical protein